MGSPFFLVEQLICERTVEGDKGGKDKRRQPAHTLGSGCPEGEADKGRRSEACEDGSEDSAGNTERAGEPGLADAQDNQGDELEEE